MVSPSPPPLPPKPNNPTQLFELGDIRFKNWKVKQIKERERLRRLERSPPPPARPPKPRNAEKFREISLADDFQIISSNSGDDYESPKNLGRKKLLLYKKRRSRRPVSRSENEDSSEFADKGKSASRHIHSTRTTNIESAAHPDTHKQNNRSKIRQDTDRKSSMENCQDLEEMGGSQRVPNVPNLSENSRLSGSVDYTTVTFQPEQVWRRSLVSPATPIDEVCEVPAASDIPSSPECDPDLSKKLDIDLQSRSENSLILANDHLSSKNLSNELDLSLSQAIDPDLSPDTDTDLTLPASLVSDLDLSTTTIQAPDLTLSITRSVSDLNLSSEREPDSNQIPSKVFDLNHSLKCFSDPDPKLTLDHDLDLPTVTDPHLLSIVSCQNVPINEHREQRDERIRSEKDDLHHKDLVDAIWLRVDHWRTLKLILERRTQENDVLGQKLQSKLRTVARSNETRKFTYLIEDVERITSLMVLLSVSLGRLENNLYAAVVEKNKDLIKRKKKRIENQIQEAQLLEVGVEARAVEVSRIIEKHFQMEDILEYRRFVNTKIRLIIETRETEERIRLALQQISILSR